MAWLVQFQISIYALIILCSLYFYVKQSKVKSFSKWWFRITIIVTSIAIIAEPLSWIFDNEFIPYAFYVEYATNFLLFLLAPMIAGLLISYVDYRIFRKPSRVFKLWFYQHVTIITLVILILNIKFKIYFSVDPLTNNFSSGDFTFIHDFLLGSCYIYMLVLTFRNIRKLTKSEIIIFVLFFFLPIAGMLISGINNRLYFSWTSVVILLLVVYIFLETVPFEEDFLTKIYNRRSYEKYLTFLIQKEAVFGIIMFDLDHFKSINDQFGHKKGDDVLIAFSNSLKEVFREEEMIARLGGDEFVIVVEKNMNHIEERIIDIKTYLLNHNDSIVNNLDFSYGYEKHLDFMSSDQLSVIADNKMYKNKQIKSK